MEDNVIDLHPAIELGVHARDTVTGFQGTVTAITAFLTGSIRIEITPVADNFGNYREARWFDEERVEVVP